MAGTQESGRESAGLGQQDDPLSTRDVAVWFVREVLPLEPILTRYLQRNWHNPSDIVDLRQEVYARVCTSAQREIPREPQRFVLVTARNLLITRLRDAQVIPIEATADIDALEVATTKTVKRSRRKVVPNLGGYIGASARYSNAKISFGYRADTFFGAMDGGQETAKDYNRGFYGPFATIGIGLP